MTIQDIVEQQPVQAIDLEKFQGSQLEFAQYCIDQFHQESSHKGVLRRVVRMLHDWFHLSEVIYLTLETSRVNGESSRKLTRFPPLPDIETDAINSVRAALQPVVSGEDEICLGHHVIQVMGDEYLCAQFDETKALRGVLVWRTTHKAEDSKLDFCAGKKAEAVTALEFLIRSAQQVAQWLRRLDMTQAMLYQDEVTGLYNYRFLDVAVDSEIRRLQRFHSPFSLLFIDLDNFKGVNDHFGHLTGSSVLRQVGREIKAAVRDVDSVIRYGGDEFVVVLLGTNSRQALHAAERIRGRIHRHEFRAEGAESVIHITTSIGVACCPEHGLDKSTIIRLADETMYAAKKSGKNKVVMAKGPSQSITSTTMKSEEF